MTSRAEVALKALSYNGLNDGTGYPGPYNVFEQELNRPQEFWCGDFVSAIFKMCKLALPVMQVGMETGFASVPLGWQYAQDHGATAPSWDAQVSDIAVFSNNVAQLGHAELVTTFDGMYLYTIGGTLGRATSMGTQVKAGCTGTSPTSNLVSATPRLSASSRRADSSSSPTPFWRLPCSSK